ncbi:MAG: autotransporter outer membrane beta-barrel domain-containing protein [Alphaproteobacteria bacterium]|nr:autotransporter outer membrane beta-barrel domain-containing protein [Alphaproteobacteria bacterium]
MSKKILFLVSFSFLLLSSPVFSKEYRHSVSSKKDMDYNLDGNDRLIVENGTLVLGTGNQVGSIFLDGPLNVVMNLSRINASSSYRSNDISVLRTGILSKGKKSTIINSRHAIIDTNGHRAVFISGSKTNLINNGKLISALRGLAVESSVTADHLIIKNGKYGLIEASSKPALRIGGADTFFVNEGNVESEEALSSTAVRTRINNKEGGLIISGLIVNGYNPSYERKGKISDYERFTYEGSSILLSGADAEIINSGMIKGFATSSGNTILSTAPGTTIINLASGVISNNTLPVISLKNSGANIFNFGNIESKEGDGIVLQDRSFGTNIWNMKGGLIKSKYGNAVRLLNVSDTTIKNHGMIVSGGYSERFLTVNERVAVFLSEGRDTTINNYGTIDGYFAGVQTFEGFSEITNSGLIKSTRNVLLLEGDDTVKNSGRLISYLQSSVDNAVIIKGTKTARIINSGEIIGSIVHKIPAIKLTGDEPDALTFKNGSFIVGDIILDSPSTLNFDRNPTHSYLLTFDGDGVLTLDEHPDMFSVPFFYNEAERKVATIDPTILILEGNVIASLSRNVSSLIAGRRGEKKSEHRSSVWFSGFRSSEDLAMEELNRVRGTVLKAPFRQEGAAMGYDYTLSSGISVGVLAGYDEASQNISNGHIRSYEKKMDGTFVAFHAGAFDLDGFFVTASVSGGMLNHKDVRYTYDNKSESGKDLATSSYVSSWFSPEVMVGAIFDINGFIVLKPSVQARYVHHSINSYTEKGTNSNASFGARSVGIQEVRGQVALSREFGNASWVGAYAGLQRLRVQNPGLISMSLIGERQNILPSVQEGSVDIYYGGDVKIRLGEHLNLKFGGEVLFRENRQYYNTNVGIEISF